MPAVQQTRAKIMPPKAQAMPWIPTPGQGLSGLVPVATFCLNPITVCMVMYRNSRVAKNSAIPALQKDQDVNSDGSNNGVAGGSTQSLLCAAVPNGCLSLNLLAPNRTSSSLDSIATPLATRDFRAFFLGFNTSCLQHTRSQRFLLGFSERLFFIRSCKIQSGRASSFSCFLQMQNFRLSSKCEITQRELCLAQGQIKCKNRGHFIQLDW